VKLQPANVATLADVDYSIWEISDVAEATFSANELDFTLSSDSVFQGNYYKYNYRQPLPTLGQRLVGTSVSNSEDGSGGTIMLTIAGLPEGEHSLLTWHNSHIGLDEYATVSVAVNGEELASVRCCSTRMEFEVLF
jgi:hypothetical protein